MVVEANWCTQTKKRRMHRLLENEDVVIELFKYLNCFERKAMRDLNENVKNVCVRLWPEFDPFELACRKSSDREFIKRYASELRRLYVCGDFIRFRICYLFGLDLGRVTRVQFSSVLMDPQDVYSICNMLPNMEWLNIEPCVKYCDERRNFMNLETGCYRQYFTLRRLEIKHNKNLNNLILACPALTHLRLYHIGLYDDNTMLWRHPILIRQQINTKLLHHRRRQCQEYSQSTIVDIVAVQGSDVQIGMPEMRILIHEDALNTDGIYIHRLLYKQQKQNIYSLIVTNSVSDHHLKWANYTKWTIDDIFPCVRILKLYNLECTFFKLIHHLCLPKLKVLSLKWCRLRSISGLVSLLCRPNLYIERLNVACIKFDELHDGIGVLDILDDSLNVVIKIRQLHVWQNYEILTIYKRFPAIWTHIQTIILYQICVTTMNDAVLCLPHFVGLQRLKFVRCDFDDVHYKDIRLINNLKKLESIHFMYCRNFDIFLPIFNRRQVVIIS